MSEHKVSVEWVRQSEDFSLAGYNRSHQWDFGHNNTVQASAAVNYCGDANKVDPEQAFTASIASCHMLTFLAVASQKGFTIDEYQDSAVGVLGKDAEGNTSITDVMLTPNVCFSGEKVPSVEQINQLHELAHRQCFIANSVKTNIRVKID